MALELPISEVASLISNGDGVFVQNISAGPRFYKNDAGQWSDIKLTQKVDLGSVVSFRDIAGNCETQYFKDHLGYKIWKPNLNSSQITNPAWVEGEDFWIQVDGPVGSISSQTGSSIVYLDSNSVQTTFPVGRVTLGQQTRLVNTQTVRPSWTISCSSNLTRQDNSGGYKWVDSNSNVVFTLKKPVAWSEATPKVTVAGTVSIDGNGVVTINVDLSSLSYPIILDPTTAFSVLAADFRAETATASWATVRGQASADSFNDTTVSHEAITYTVDGGVNVAIGRSGELFDTSTVGAAATITDAILTLHIQDIGNPDLTTIEVCQGSYPVPSSAADYSSFTFVSGCSRAVSSLVGNVDNGLILTSTGRGFINKTGITKFMIVNGRDFTNTAPTDYDYVTWHSAENTVPPVLSITYSVSAPAPVIILISPNTGATAGATPVTITGANFQSGATVKFDTSSATSVSFVNSNTLTCVTPAHVAGAVTVTVTNPDTQSAPFANGFTYTALSVRGIRGWSPDPIVLTTGEHSIEIDHDCTTGLQDLYIDGVYKASRYVALTSSDSLNYKQSFERKSTGSGSIYVDDVLFHRHS